MNTEMANPFRGDGPRKTPPGSGKEWNKIGFLILLLLAVAVMVGIHFSKPRNPIEGAQNKTVQFKDAEKTPPQEQTPSPELEALEQSAKDSLPTLIDSREKIDKSGEGFLRHLYLFLGLTSKEVSKRVTSELTATKLLEKPDEYRGKYVRLKGRLIQLYTEPLHVTTTTGTKDVYLGIMETRPDAKTVAFYLGEHPVNALTGEPMIFHTQQYQGQELMRDWVQIEGMFLRVWEYEGEPFPSGAPRWIPAPELFVKNIQPTIAPRGKDNSQTNLVILIGSVFGGIVVVVLFGGWMAGKYNKGNLRMRMLEVKRKQNRPVFPEKKPSTEVLGEEVKPPEDPPETAL